ncbi:MAG: DUF1343 domain-containing protein [Opitutae bacterium]|nr:DUF1343 domain-containing protein [Opitutae bacterium]
MPCFLLCGAETKIYLGIDVLEANRFSVLKGKRVGILTHPAGVNRKGISTIDVLRRSRHVKVVALFGPEHGIYGDEKANQPIDNRIDARTNLPVYSLYGRYRKPQPDMLANIDTLVIDLQDIGVRSYTYVSCMLYAMEACFENDVEVVVLDRPNPLGGNKIDGPLLEKEWKSYVGAFPVPYLHGLTIGELAILAKSMPNWMNIESNLRRQGRLKVIPMRGWERSMLWPETHLNWIPTSPYIPSFAAVLGYAMTGLGAQEGSFSHGIGTPYPFRLLSHKKVPSDILIKRLKALNITGIDYKVIRTRNAKGAPVSGVYVGINNWRQLKPTELSFYMMLMVIDLEEPNPFQITNRSALFNKHVGSSQWWSELTQNKRKPKIRHFLNLWEQQHQSYKKKIENYLIYH